MVRFSDPDELAFLDSMKDGRLCESANMELFLKQYRNALERAARGILKRKYVSNEIGSFENPVEVIIPKLLEIIINEKLVDNYNASRSTFSTWIINITSVQFNKYFFPKEMYPLQIVRLAKKIYEENEKRLSQGDGKLTKSECCVLFNCKKATFEIALNCLDFQNNSEPYYGNREYNNSVEIPDTIISSNNPLNESWNHSWLQEDNVTKAAGNLTNNGFSVPSNISANHILYINNLLFIKGEGEKDIFSKLEKKILFYRFLGLKNQEIGKICGTSTGTVSSTVDRIRAKLKKIRINFDK